MNDWRELVPGCFGVQDGEFALNQLEVDRAVAMIAKAKTDGGYPDEVREALLAHGLSLGWSDEHLSSQCERIDVIMAKHWQK